MSNYIKVETLTGIHIIKIENILSISPKSGEKIQTQIKVIEGNEINLYFTTESQEKVLEKLLKK